MLFWNILCCIVRLNSVCAGDKAAKAVMKCHCDAYALRPLPHFILNPAPVILTMRLAAIICRRGVDDGILEVCSVTYRETQAMNAKCSIFDVIRILQKGFVSDSCAASGVMHLFFSCPPLYQHVSRPGISQGRIRFW